MFLFTLKIHSCVYLVIHILYYLLYAGGAKIGGKRNGKPDCCLFGKTIYGLKISNHHLIIYAKVPRVQEIPKLKCHSKYRKWCLTVLRNDYHRLILTTVLIVIMRIDSIDIISDTSIHVFVFQSLRRSLIIAQKIWCSIIDFILIIKSDSHIAHCCLWYDAISWLIVNLDHSLSFWTVVICHFLKAFLNFQNQIKSMDLTMMFFNFFLIFFSFHGWLWQGIIDLVFSW